MNKPDEIIGIAVLGTLSNGGEYLFVQCRSDAHRTIQEIHIPVKPKGSSSHPGGKCWEYEIAGDMIHVTPSLKIFGGAGGTENFHNAGAWSVKFVRRDEDPGDFASALNRDLRDEVRERWQRQD